jgi:hypothetical protein
MKSRRSKDFKKLFARLPMRVQKDTEEAYELFRKDPYHPSLQFKRIDGQDPIYSTRIGLHYRAVGWYENGIR